MRPLPAICPECHERGREVRLGQLVCSECGAAYPQADGVPVLLADARLRDAVFAGASADERASFYQNNSEFLRNGIEGHEALVSYLAEAPPAGVVLEIGSGAGAFRATGGEDYCALDLSLTFLRRYLTGARRVCASAENVPLASGSCRFVFSIAALEHVPRPDRAFEEIDRVLAPGGIAYVAPAWHCRDWAADGLPVRPYRDLTPSQKLRKVLIPLRDSVAYRGATEVPLRVLRRASARLRNAPTALRFRPLVANYSTFWMADSDACASIDSHEGLMFFESRGYALLRPRGGTITRLLFRAGALVVKKPV